MDTNETPRLAPTMRELQPEVLEARLFALEERVKGLQKKLDEITQQEEEKHER